MDLEYLGGPGALATADPGTGRAGKPAATRLVGFLGSLGSRLSPPLPPPNRLGRLQPFLFHSASRRLLTLKGMQTVCKWQVAIVSICRSLARDLFSALFRCDGVQVAQM